MKLLHRRFGIVTLGFCLSATSAHAGATLDSVLNAENVDRNVKAAATIDDTAFLRRATIDLIGRIPTVEEIDEYQAWPAAERRTRLIDKLLKTPGFGDRWTVFMADMLRVRSNADGGSALLAWLHKAVDDGMPYDVLCRQLLTATGKANKIPEVGFALNDNADPMALASSTAQTFLGVRIGCAQCHDHPFDVWKQEQFYELAAFFGKLQKRESELTRAVYTVENTSTRILWPPEGDVPDNERKPMTPKFPFIVDTDARAPHVLRFVSLRKEQEEAKNKKPETTDVDSLLADVGGKLSAKKGPSLDEKAASFFDVGGEAKQAARDLKIEQDVFNQSKLRKELADLITDPRNRYFARNFVNRVWSDLMGLGFVNPVDDFSESNQPSHPKTMDFLADEFVAGGFDMRSIVKLVMLSDAYSRGHLMGVDDESRKNAEGAFAATPIRRMPAETLFDSLVTAGHLFQQKHAEGDNLKTITEIVRVPVIVDRTAKGNTVAAVLAGSEGDGGAMAGKGMAGKPMIVGGGYDLETAIEIDFNAILMKAAKDDDGPADAMAKMSPEDIEAREMLDQQTQRKKYIEKKVEVQIDDNPQFASAMRMPSPAPPAHFLRIFGQPGRDQLGDLRESDPSMRQALMMLNGKLSHEASRVGRLEPMHKLVTGKSPNVEGAVKLAYREILTREPSADELADATSIVAEAASPVEGIADLRWVLFNTHEFRFIP